MKLGILSDTHNNTANLRRALAIFREEGAARLIHCGDLTRPAVIEEFVGWRVNFVYGNGDYEQADLAYNVKHLLEDSSIGPEWGGEIGGVRLAAIHGDIHHRMMDLIRGGLYAYVFRGHSHLRLDKLDGQARVINPGSLGGKRSQTRSICVLDIATGEARFIEIED